MNTDNRPLILVSNDDGYEAPGVHELIRRLIPYGEVVAVCPDGPRSGQSMAITIRGRRPSLVAAGINHGSNAAINVVYSGTMGAVFEGCAFGIPSVGFSLTDHAHDADFTPCLPFIDRISREVLAHGLPEGMCLNVNIPNCGHVPEKMRVVRACKGTWSDEYKEYTDPHGRKFYWLTGKFENLEPNNRDTDEWCLSHDIVSVVPTLLDRTMPLAEAPSWLALLEEPEE